MEIAQGIESAATNGRKLTDSKNTTQSSTTVIEWEPIHQIGAKGKSCYRCGSRTHLATTCKFKETVCHNCGKIAYLQKVCHSKPQPKTPSKDKSAPKGQERDSLCRGTVPSGRQPNR